MAFITFPLRQKATSDYTVPKPAMHGIRSYICRRGVGLPHPISISQMHGSLAQAALPRGYGVHGACYRHASLSRSSPRRYQTYGINDTGATYSTRSSHPS
ncbi:hypothetical protein PMIN03_010732 [Paraphaeosphaeria minitans]